MLAAPGLSAQLRYVGPDGENRRTFDLRFDRAQARHRAKNSDC